MLYSSLSILLSIAMITGCGVNENDQERSRGIEAQNIRNDDNQDSTLIERDNNRHRATNTNNRATNNNNSNMEKADQASNKVAKLEEVRTANVIVTNRNAYVAVVLSNNKDNKGKLSKKVEDKIAKAVRESEEDIQNVYVSTNPDFVNRMTGYGDRIQRGEPVRGFMDEFTEMVRRVFPNAR
ncbi:YhcN/YlaJ family sporulation lipoprotein [Bacillus sp. 31A1R]|uniref:YhcN/YlaJ family sporulation lipoprotein n=1 Tax=Robertmurraya mangrovi TaxID=3098077 RepID=A0ABU5J328_9BACI|nr:YhcN/YlaJ family sporulation lipoprotein [Bacillus sp. 31A1R]MDZ5473770.1 YhcN/YlaJ family sporulation lipoprotein [Bacillus sp. 31A1R]